MLLIVYATFYTAFAVAMIAGPFLVGGRNQPIGLDAILLLGILIPSVAAIWYLALYGG